jgi:restriction system protein
MEAWEDRWKRVQEVESKRQLKQQTSQFAHVNKEIARTRTDECQRAIAQVEGILRDGIELDHRVNWEALKDRHAFSVPRPSPPLTKQIPAPPLASHYAPSLSWFQQLIPALQRKPREEADRRFKQVEQVWRGGKENIERENAQAIAEHEKAMRAWEIQSQEFRDQRSAQHREVDLMRSRYTDKGSTGLNDYWEIVLHKSKYPDLFPKSFLLEYLPESRTLIVEYALPSMACLPSVKEVKYVQVRNMFQEAAVSQSWLNKSYDEVLYQIALRTLYELFQSDAAEVVDSIVFNGWVNSVDKATGQEVNACILSIQVNKSEFMAVNLAQVEPRACFKKFKGVSAAKLTELTPVRPVLQLNKEDRRFISPYDVVDALDSSTNIAAMDWQDFENLIRELFEKEFSQKRRRGEDNAG